MVFASMAPSDLRIARTNRARRSAIPSWISPAGAALVAASGGFRPPIRRPKAKFEQAHASPVRRRRRTSAGPNSGFSFLNFSAGAIAVFSSAWLRRRNVLRIPGAQAAQKGGRDGFFLAHLGGAGLMLQRSALHRFYPQAVSSGRAAARVRRSLLRTALPPISRDRGGPDKIAARNE